MCNISATGARLQVEPSRFGSAMATIDLPEHLKLVIRSDKTEVRCRVVWRNGNQLGVRFEGAMRMASKPQALKMSASR